jgi:membrane fusion protein (multidrug efflux system)
MNKLESLPRSPVPGAAGGKRWRNAAIGLVVIGMAAGGWTLAQRSASKPGAAQADTAAAQKAPEAPEVYELASGDIAAIDARSLSIRLPLSGSLTPLTQATIKSKVSGAVQETTAQEGMAVSAGQVLARLDTADLKARVTQQEAALDEARAKLAMASKNEANNLALLDKKYISQTAYDTTQNAVELARANVKSASAQVEIARIALADTVIRAPFSGIVSKRHVQAGEKLSPDTPVFTIVNLAQMTLEAQVPASDIPRISIGQEVQFKVDGFQERAFAGKVARINPTTEAGSRAMLVYIAVDNKDGALRGGMFAKGAITTARSPVMPLVPLAAVRAGREGPVVYRIDQGKVVAQPVTLGLRNDDEGMAEVRQGLQAGASVIVSRLDSVRPGSRVKLPAATAAGAATTPEQAVHATPAKPALVAQKG